jgi:acyl-CoA thioester hydrolase
MLKHETKIRVRYSETDQMGYVYYGNYPQFLEVARAELLRSIEMPYKSFEELGIMMPVTELSIKYIKPARYDDEITIITYLKKMPGIRIYLSHELYNEKKELLTTAELTLVLIDMKTNRPSLPPTQFIAKLNPYFELEIK